MADQDDSETLRADLRAAWHRYVDLLAPQRPALYGLCRRLTGNLWDAEDLAQDTLLRAFGQWGVSYGQVRDPRAYLLRTATNVWIDTLRHRDIEARALLETSADAGAGTVQPETAGEIRSASARLLQRLSPQESAAVVLKETFDMTLEDIAGLLATTTGAVKAALHRGRARLRESDAGESHRPVPSAELVDRFIELYRGADVKGLVALMIEGGSAENPGNSFHVGPDSAEGFPRFLRSVVHGHVEWPPQWQPESERLERVTFQGEPMVLAFRIYHGSEEALTSIFRFEEREGRIARIRSYAFCPETMRAVGAILGVRVLTGLYRAPTPAPGVDWPEAPSAR
jgi:RNA polymerase sigma-70 factor (ECF subfamily)